MEPNPYEPPKKTGYKRGNLRALGIAQIAVTLVSTGAAVALIVFLVWMVFRRMAS